MKGFSGFPAGKVHFTPLPNLFFSKLLPAIDDLAELKVTLHIFWLLHHKKGYPRYVSRRELEADGVLLGGLRGPGQEPAERLGQALERAVARGTLLHVTALQGDERVEAVITPSEVRLEVERPNVFVLYEQNIGLLTPLIAEELRDAEKTYPADWIEEAFRIAVEHNARRWRYVHSVLERMAAEGKGSEEAGRGTGEDRRRYIEGKYADYIEH
jgi:DNA replication protein